jgi:elongation factor Ts
MAEITAKKVKELRDATGVSMMECKKALQESDGDIEQATTILRQRGVAIASKKASRTANQGLIGSHITDDGKVGSLVEVNCETDFVARNDVFRKFVEDLSRRACETGDDLAETVKDEITAKITELGENVVLKRYETFQLEQTGRLGSYIHLGGKVGVLVEVGCGKEETVSSAVFQDLVKDLTLHIAAASPQYLEPGDVPEDVIESERKIYAEQVKDKPENIIDKIVDGKLNKYFEEICLIKQGFVKEPKTSISDLVEAKGKELGDTVTIRRYLRYQLGA